MRLKAKFQVPVVDLAKFKEALHQLLSEKLVEGCQTWLNTVVKESTAAGLPIWSAASISTFSPLASHVAFALANTPIGDAPNRVQLGLDNGHAEFDAGKERPGLYTFTYSTTLPHLIINEYHNANAFLDSEGKPYFHLKNPGPYNFQKKAELAWRQKMLDIRLPGWESILTVHTIVKG